jgi:hypothetical protein
MGERPWFGKDFSGSGASIRRRWERNPGVGSHGGYHGRPAVTGSAVVLVAGGEDDVRLERGGVRGSSVKRPGDSPRTGNRVLESLKPIMSCR